MTLGPGPGILADFWAVRSSTPPCGDTPDGAPSSDGAAASLFDDLVGAWLAPAKDDDDDAGDSADVVADTTLTTFSFPLPLLPAPSLPVTGSAPQGPPGTGAPKSTDRASSTLDIKVAPIQFQQAAECTPHIDPARVARPASPPPQREAPVEHSWTASEAEPTAARIATQAGMDVTRDSLWGGVTPDSRDEGRRIRRVREFPGLTRAMPAAASESDRSTPEAIELAAADPRKAAPATRTQVPQPWLTPLVTPRTAATSSPVVSPAPVADVPASSAAIPAEPADAIEPLSIGEPLEFAAVSPPGDEVLPDASQTESAEAPSGVPTEKATRRVSDVPHRASERAEAPRPPHETGPVSVRSVAKTAVAPTVQEPADVLATRPPDARPTLTTAVENPAPSDRSIAKNEFRSDGSRARSFQPVRHENLAQPTVDAVTPEAGPPEMQIRTVATTPMGARVPTPLASVEAPGSAEPRPVETVEKSRDVSAAMAASPPDREASGDRGGEPHRDPSSRETAEHAEQIARSNTPPSFADRAGPREPSAGPTPPARPAIALVHETAPAFSAATLPQPVPVVASDAPAAASPAPDTADRIVQSLKLQVQRGGGDAIVHLQPEHLGPVAISLRVENGAVSAVIRAEQPAVAEWLQSNQQSLRDGLQASGLQLERLVVQRDGQSPSDRQRREWADSRRRELRRRVPQADSTFDISV